MKIVIRCSGNSHQRRIYRRRLFRILISETSNFRACGHDDFMDSFNNTKQGNYMSEEKRYSPKAAWETPLPSNPYIDSMNAFNKDDDNRFIPKESIDRIRRANKLLDELGGLDILSALEELKVRRQADARYHSGVNILLHLIAANAYRAWSNCLGGNPSEEQMEYFERAKNPIVGDFVLEISGNGLPSERIGKLISVTEEPYPWPEEEGKPPPTRDIWTIEIWNNKTNAFDKPFTWENCTFIAVPTNKYGKGYQFSLSTEGFFL